jgi:hypothetical protein
MLPHNTLSMLPSHVHVNNMRRLSYFANMFFASFCDSSQVTRNEGERPPVCSFGRSAN